MTRKDVLELKKRLQRSECTFTKMTGCYVNANREVVLTFEETFLNLEDEEFYKYLEIAKKALSGTVGNNLLELDFPTEEETTDGKQQFLMGLKDSKLKAESLLTIFYQLIMDHYDYVGNYLILLFHDAYDVMARTSDNRKLDESEEVYEYILCAICPVSLSKPGLGYLVNENRIGPRNRDWLVGAPDTGFLFPCFTDRSSDIHSLLYYTKDAKSPQEEFVAKALGCLPKKTATQQKNTFQSIISHAIPDEGQRAEVILEIQESLNQLAEDQDTFSNSTQDANILTTDKVQELLTDSGLSEEIASKIETAYKENFGDTPPVIDHLLDSKLLAEHSKKKKEKELVDKVHKLQELLDESTQMQASNFTSAKDDLSFEFNDDSKANNNETNEDNKISNIDPSTNLNYDVVLHVKPQKVNQISSQMIDGKKCIVIPVEENEQIKVNGVTI